MGTGCVAAWDLLGDCPNYALKKAQWEIIILKLRLQALKKISTKLNTQKKTRDTNIYNRP